jgi:predicted small lipoprotein YifL|tara:strand:- start:392 stop:511 length:120 start_codon:yes stop_codon:yes gene_type:complete
MNRAILFFLLLTGLFGLSACGVKGPLTLPDAKTLSYETK